MGLLLNDCRSESTCFVCYKKKTPHAAGLICVSERIKNAQIPYDKRPQITLPEKHHVTGIIIDAVHKQKLHVGPSGLRAMVRQRFWLIHGKKLIREYARKCIFCFKINPQKIDLCKLL